MRWCSLLAAAAILVCADARAGTFDPSGNFSFDASATVTVGFDDLATPPQGVKLVRSGGAVQGAAYVNVNTQNTAASFALSLPKSDSRLRRRRAPWAIAARSEMHSSPTT